jgi:hypothetical protein
MCLLVPTRNIYEFKVSSKYTKEFSPNSLWLIHDGPLYFTWVIAPRWKAFTKCRANKLWLHLTSMLFTSGMPQPKPLTYKECLGPWPCLRSHFRLGSMVQNLEEPIWTCLKQIESLSWTLPWNLSLHLGFSNPELSPLLSSFFWGLTTNWFYLQNGVM